LWYILALDVSWMFLPSPDETLAYFFSSKRWNMKSYSMVATAVLMAGAWLGTDLRVYAVQQPATPTDTAQKAANPVAAASPAANQAGTATPTAPSKPAFYILAEFSQSLNVKKLKPGDPIKAQVSQDVLSHGKIIIPVESKLVGHVTEAKAYQAEDRESRLGIVFDKVILKHPREVDFLAVVQRLEPPVERLSRVDKPSQMLPVGGMGGGAMSPVPMTTGMSNGPSRGGANSSSSSIATNPAGAPTFSPPPSPSDPPSRVRRGTGPVAPAEQQQAMSTGMPLGVFGIKGLTLLPGPNVNTPGPVILSRTGDVKLENGTQVLLRVTDANVPQP
jgi:hypothetical protein